MMNGQASPVIRYIRKLATCPDTGELADGALLEQFVTSKDEAAFEALVRRYGPLVLSVCRRVLHHEQDVEDAFQATFLVFVRKASSIDKRESVGSWLYGVAYRTAVKARTGLLRRLARETALGDVPVLEPTPEWVWQEFRLVLDQEVNGLPERYRVPFVLCHLEGKTNEQAARQLGCPLGTILSRLSRARGLLRNRLTRRGVVLSTGLLTTALAEKAAAAGLADAMVKSVLRTALPHTVQTTATTGAVSAEVARLANGVIQAMFMTKLKIAAAVVLAFSLVGTGAALLAYPGLAEQPSQALEEKQAQSGAKDPGKPESPSAGQAKTQKDAAPPAAAKDAEDREGIVTIPSRREGVVLVIGTEVKEGEKVPPDQIVTVKVSGELKKYRRLKKGDKVEPGQLLARVDDQFARTDVGIKEAKLLSSEADLMASLKTRDEAKERLNTQMKLFKGKSSSIEDMRGAQLTHDRYVAEGISKEQAVKVARLELIQAQAILEMYEIRTQHRGVIKRIHKHQGEAVQSLETVFTLQLLEDRK